MAGRWDSKDLIPRTISENLVRDPEVSKPSYPVTSCGVSESGTIYVARNNCFCSSPGG